MNIPGKNYYISICGMHFALDTIFLLKSKDLWLKQIVRAKFIYISELKVCQDKSWQLLHVYMFLQKGCHGQRHSLAYMRVNLNLF